MRGGQEADGFGHVPVGRGRADTEPGCELGVGTPVAQMGKGEQGLPADAQPAPSAGDRTAMFADTSGEEAKMRAGQVQSRRVDKY